MPEPLAAADLVTSAKTHFNRDIKPAEEILFRNTANGTTADCAQGVVS